MTAQSLPQNFNATTTHEVGHLRPIKKGDLLDIISPQKWRDDFRPLEMKHGDFTSFTPDGWLVTGVTSSGVFHLRKKDMVVYGTFSAPEVAILALYAG